MATSVGGAKVAVTADLSRFAREAQADLNRALRSVKVDGVQRQFDDLGRTARENAEDFKNAFQRSGEQVEDALREVGNEGEQQFDRLEREARDASRAMSGGFGGALGAMRSLGPAVAVVGAAFAAAGIGRFVVDAVQAADQLNDALAISEQIIDQTGGAAGLLADEVREISRSLSLEIGVDSAQVQSAANVLLTFRNVSEDSFDTALGLAADLSTVLGTDLQGATLQLGKALNDPVRGISALARAGVQFTDSQRQQIAALVENNDLLGAQQIILGELESQVGGTAAVAADSWARVTNAFTESQRALGDALIPALDAIAPALIGVIGELEPAFAAIGSGLGDALTAAGPGIEAFVGALGEAFEVIGPSLGPLGGALGAVLEALSPLLPVIGELTAAFLPPLAAIITELAGPLETLAVLLAEHFRRGLELIEPHLPAIVELFGQLSDVMSRNLLQTFPVLSDAILELLVAILPLIPALIEITEAMMPLFENGEAVAAILSALVDLTLLLLVPALEQLTALLTGDLAGAFPLVAGQVELLKGVLGSIGGVVSNVIGFFTRLRDGARDKFDSLLALVRGIPGRIVSALGNLSQLLRDAGRRVIEGFLDGIRGMIPDLSGLLGSITDMIPDIKGPPARDRELLRSAGQLVMQGFQTGIQDERDNVRRLLESVTGDIGTTALSGRVAGGDGASAAGAAAAAPIVQVFIDGREIEGAVVRVVNQRDRDISRRIRAGTGMIR